MSVQPRHHPPTYDDLRSLPDDVRAEILDGEIIVTRSANPRHNLKARRLANDIEQVALPAGFAAVTDVDVLWPVTGEVTRPDVAVVSAELAEGTELPIAERPILVVEVLSPTSATRDYVLKRRTAQAAGVPEYWVVDPDSNEIVRHTLADGRYEDHVLRPGDQERVETLPFEYTLRPAVLGPLPSQADPTRA